ncbi:hypothetical protein [Kineosporia sp. NBRC 101731]|nr:hypothetical protein [Kineosporia sp. NBRC 101731]GLY29882.1 hypothetical protein Kisp02_32470 [Kineosporia sp. NBRC 101731]
MRDHDVTAPDALDQAIALAKQKIEREHNEPALATGTHPASPSTPTA